MRRLTASIYILAALLCTSITSSPLPESGTISATARVEQPIGLVQFGEDNKPKHFLRSPESTEIVLQISDEGHNNSGSGITLSTIMVEGDINCVTSLDEIANFDKIPENDSVIMTFIIPGQ